MFLKRFLAGLALAIATAGFIPANASLVHIQANGVVTYADGSTPAGSTMSIDVLFDVNPGNFFFDENITKYSHITASYYVSDDFSIKYFKVNIGNNSYDIDQFVLDRYERIGFDDFGNCCDDFTYSTFHLAFFGNVGLSTVDIYSLSHNFSGNILDPLDSPGGEFGFDNIGDSSTIGGTLYRLTSSIVPEPTSWVMLVGGFGLVGKAMRRRHKGWRKFAQTESREASSDVCVPIFGIRSVGSCPRRST